MPVDLTPYRSLYPFASHWLDIIGLRYHYVDEGAGDPVVCVHGNPTWSFYFREVIAGLRATHRVIAVDHIGCGLSDKPGDDAYDYVLRRRVDDLETLLDHLGLTDNVTLVLHDWGGMIGMAAALRRPERVARLVLLNTAAFLLPPGKRLPLRLRLIRDVRGLGALLVRGCNAFAYGATRMASKKGLSAAVSAAYRAPYDNWENRIATLRFVQDIPLRPGDPSYETAKWVDDHLYLLRDLPTLICWGEGDFVFDRHFLAEWRRRLPHAETHAFPDAGHYCLDDAGDRIIPLIHDFLRRHPRTGHAALCSEAAP
jgi:haloalkane dehalogenase